MKFFTFSMTMGAAMLALAASSTKLQQVWQATVWFARGIIKYNSKIIINQYFRTQKLTGFAWASKISERKTTGNVSYLMHLQSNITDSIFYNYWNNLGRWEGGRSREKWYSFLRAESKSYIILRMTQTITLIFEHIHCSIQVLSQLFI